MRFKGGVSIVKGKCRRIVETVLAIAGCGKAGIVEFPLGGIDER